MKIDKAKLVWVLGRFDVDADVQLTASPGQLLVSAGGADLAVPAEGGDVWAMSVAHKRLATKIKKIPGGTIDLVVDGETLAASGGGMRLGEPCRPAEPRTLDRLVDGMRATDAPALARALRRSTLRREWAPGNHVWVAGDRVVSTDGYRAYEIAAPWSFRDGWIGVPYRVRLALAEVADGEGFLYIVDDDLIATSTNGRVRCGLSREFPANMSDLLDRACASDGATLCAADVYALATCVDLHKAPTISLVANDGTLRVESHGGEAATFEFRLVEPVTVPMRGIDPKYLREALKAAGKGAALEIHDVMDPVGIHTDGFRAAIAGKRL